MKKQICSHYKKTIYDNKGLGGVKWFCTDLETQEQFILKPNDKVQGYNEYFAQTLIELLHLPHLNNKWCKSGGEMLCGTIYEKGLKKIRKNEVLNFTREQRKQFLSLFVVNRVLLNYDFVEFYSRPNGEVVTLDFGESLFLDLDFFKTCEIYLNNTEMLGSAIKSNLTPEKMGEVLKELAKYKMGRFDEDYDEAVLGVYRDVRLLTEDSFKSFLLEFKEYVGEWEYNYFGKIIKAFIDAMNHTERPLLWNDIILED